MPVRKVAILLFVMLLSVGGCSRPLVDGAQVGRIPAGFGFDANARAGRLVFPERQKVDQRGYFTFGSDDVHSDIIITEYAGETTYEQAVAARGAAASKYGYATYGPVETLTVDGRPAWGWTETQRSQGQVTGLELTVVVSYAEGARTYSVEFYSCDSRYMDEAFMMKTLESFTVKSKGLSKAKIGMTALVLAGAWFAFTRFRSQT